MIKELDIIELTKDVRNDYNTYSAGTVGVVVMVHDGGKAYEIEVFSPPAVIFAWHKEISPKTVPLRIALT